MQNKTAKFLRFFFCSICSSQAHFDGWHVLCQKKSSLLGSKNRQKSSFQWFPDSGVAGDTESFRAVRCCWEFCRTRWCRRCRSEAYCRFHNPQRGGTPNTTFLFSFFLFLFLFTAGFFIYCWVSSFFFSPFFFLVLY